MSGKSKEAKETKDSKESRPKRGQVNAAQSTLDGKVMRKVSFAVEDKEFQEFKMKTEEEIRKLKQDALDMEKVKVELKERNLELLERVEKLEKRLLEWENKDREKSERLEKWRAEVESRFDESSEVGDTGPGSEHSSMRSGAARSVSASGRSGVSVVSGMSRVSLTERDVAQMKKMLADKIKSDNQDVIVIRGYEIENIEEIKQEVGKMIINKLGVNVAIINVWKRGKVIVVKLNSYEDKETVMRNKNKLAGTKIFIENFRSYDERKRQDEISA